MFCSWFTRLGPLETVLRNVAALMLTVLLTHLPPLAPLLVPAVLAGVAGLIGGRYLRARLPGRRSSLLAIVLPLVSMLPITAWAFHAGLGHLPIPPGHGLPPLILVLDVARCTLALALLGDPPDQWRPWLRDRSLTMRLPSSNRAIPRS